MKREFSTSRFVRIVLFKRTVRLSLYVNININWLILSYPISLRVVVSDCVQAIDLLSLSNFLKAARTL